MTVVDSRVKVTSRIAGESCGESSGDSCHNVIAGRRRTRFLNVLKTGFPVVLATLITATHKLRPLFTVFGWEERRKQDLPRLNGVNFRAMHLCAYHACRKNRACAFLAGFRGLLPVCRFPVRNALRLSGGADNGCYGNVKTFPLIKKPRKIIQQPQT